MESLVALCREHPLREKILVVPSLAIGHQIGDRIAQGGDAWINLRVETVRTLSDAVAGFELAREGITVLSRAQALSLVERACDTALDSDSYFGAIADRPGLHRAVQRSLDDLRLAGVRPESLPANAFEDPLKAKDLARILASYEEELSRGSFVDRPGVLERAIAMLRSGDRSPYNEDALWVIVEDATRRPKEGEFLDLVATKTNTITIAADSSPAVKPEMLFVRAIGEENEIRGALRSVLSERLPFDDVELVYTNRESYLARSYELVSELAIPATFAEGIAASFTRPGMAVLGFLEWVGGGYEALAIQDIVRAGAVRLSRYAPPDSQVTSRGIVRILRQASIGWGRDRYLPRLQALLAERRSSLEDPELNEARRLGIRRELANCSTGMKLFEHLLQLTAAFPDQGELEVSALANAAAAFVQNVALTSNEIDGMAQQALVRMLSELAVLPSSPLPRREATQRLRDAVIHLHVAASNPRPGHLHVVPVRLAAWSGRSRLFVAGLDDAKHPGQGTQEPILLDSERQSMNATIHPRRLELASERPLRRRDEFFAMLARCGARTRPGRVTLSYSAFEFLEGRDAFPSSTLLDAYRHSCGNELATYDDLFAASEAEATGFIPRQSSLNESEWWLAQIFPHERRGALDDIEAAYPWLASGSEAVAARESENFTKWDGRIDAPPETLDPRRSGKVFSASRLEKLASCPFRYFLEYVLRISPIEDLERDPETWLSPRDFGSLLHEVLQLFMEEICGNAEKPSLKRHGTRISEIADQQLAQWKAEVPPPNESAFGRQRDDLLEACEVFLRIEEKECGRVTPKYFEESFGYDDSSLPDFAIPLGHGKEVRVRGRIDRVDKDDREPLWDVWDYKSGSTYKYERGGRLARGTRIQHAIYARAVEAMLARDGLPDKVRRSGYYFPTRRGAGRRTAVSSEERELREVLNLLCDVAASGIFVHGSCEECRFCDFTEICAGADYAAQRASAKAAKNETEPGVEAWLKLQRIE